MTPRAHIPKATRRAAAKQQHGLCPDCKLVITGSCQLDHWIELADGGTNDLENLRYRHAKTCHAPKTTRGQKARAKVRHIIAKREGTQKPKRPMQSRPFQPHPKGYKWPKGRKLQSRGLRS